MTTCIIAFLIAFLVAIVATRLIIPIAVRFDLVDRPDYVRKFHLRAVPCTGGAGIYAAFLVPVAALYFFDLNFISQLLAGLPAALLGLLIGATIALVMGFVDDVRGLPTHWKLLLQAVAATVAFMAGYSITEINIPFCGIIELGAVSYPLTLFWFLGCMNALNFLDGLDGLAAGVSLLVSTTLFLVSLVLDNIVCMLLSISLGGAILGFLIFNFHPARIFLGDSGSMLLGFCIGSLSILASTTTETTVSFFIPLVALGLPILDTSFVIARRWFHKLPIASPDRRHIHYTLISMGLGHKRTVLVLYLACVVFGAAALLMTWERGEATLLVLGTVCIIAFVCVRVFGGIDLAGIVGRGFDAGARAALERALQEMQKAGEIEGLWRSCHPALQAIGLNRAELRLTGPSPDDTHVLVWSKRRDADAAGTAALEGDRWSARLSIRASNADIQGALEIVKLSPPDQRMDLVSELVDSLREALSVHLERVSAPAAPGPRTDR